MKTPMQAIIEAILFHNGLFELFMEAEDFHVRLTNGPWQPLVVERHGDEISITHYVEQDGDLIPDPEMVFSLREVTAVMPLFEGWAPKSTQPGGFGRIYRTLSYTDCRLAGYYRRPMKEAYAFARMWAQNLRAQKFVKRYAVGEIKSCTPAVVARLAEVQALKEVPIRISRGELAHVDGTKSYDFFFPENLPRSLRKAGYRQAEAALLQAFPYANDADHSYALCGMGYTFHDWPLPPCTCGGLALQTQTA